MSSVETERYRNGSSRRRDEERKFSEDRRKRRSRSPVKERHRDRDRDSRDKRRRSRSREDDRRRKRRHEEGRDREDRHSKRSFREDKDKPVVNKEANDFEAVKRAFHEKVQAMKKEMKIVAGQEPCFKTEAIKPEEALIYADYHLTNQQKNEKLEEMKRKLKENIAFKKLQQQQQEAKAAAPAAPVEPEKPKMVLDMRPELPQLSQVDPRVSQRPANRFRRKGFTFVDQGTFQKQAQKERTQAKLAQLQNNISTIAKQTGISSAVKLAIATPSGADIQDDLPDMEWWDKVLLEEGSYDDVPSTALPIDQRYGTKITNLIEHPVQLKPPDAELDNICIKAHLTKKERKKLRRMNRKEVQREEMEKIRLGLKKAPEPKVKMANLMRVLGQEAIQDPTKMENYVRDQVAERLRKHEQANLDRQLTKEQRSEKKRRKIMEDTSIQVYVTIYKVLSLANPKKRFKVEANANQLQMTGVIVAVEDMHVIVVEGGPKQQKFYKNLLMNRIKWNEEMVGQKKAAKEDEEGQRNECILIWEGLVPNRNFSDPPQIIHATDHKTARDVFLKHGVPHYWDHCFAHSVFNDNNE